MGTTRTRNGNSNQTPTGQALEKASGGAGQLVKQYETSFIAVLPSHITKPETWIRLAQSALRKGKVLSNGRYELEVAANNNPNRFLAELLEAARLGLEPGTDEFYLTTRKPNKNAAAEIQGIVGYQGYIELMYRAGAVSSVICELVHAKDVFVWKPGSLDTEMIAQGKPPRWDGPQRCPFHDIDWDADDRGALRLTYAYAVMKDGAYSKVVVLNRHDINRIKAKSPSAKSEYSPWTTNEGSMWLKSGARQLRKWVPTSAEYRREMLRSADAANEQRDVLEIPAPTGGQDHYDSPDDDEIVEAEIVENGNHYDEDDPERPFE